MPRILICDPIDPIGTEKLKNAGFTVEFLDSKEMLKERIRDYDAIIVRSRTKVTREIINNGKNLKLIARAGSGLDNIDLKAAGEKGIAVINTPEASADSVAELTIGLMVSLARGIPRADYSMKRGEWLKKELMGFLLKGKKLGLIGLGRIGSRVARIAKAMGMEILVTKRTPPPPELMKSLEAKFLPLDELLRQSDIVSIHVPLTEETKNMINAEKIGLMKDGAYLINTSRGEVVDEEALLEALRSGKLGGAALDVYSTEPPKRLELIKQPNVICTPHIGAQTVEVQKEASKEIAEKIIQFFNNHKAR